jgi:radical SAM superfamily enzyme YgiQ (UPF0313 family)
MKIALVGAELEENLGLRYIAASLERDGHEALIVPFNAESEIPQVVEQVAAAAPTLIGLSMVFTGRAREFCRLAQALRAGGCRGHLIAGGHFASFNAEFLLERFPAFDSIGLCEGEELMCRLAANGGDPSAVSGLAYRSGAGTVCLNPSQGNPADLDALPFPKRTTFHSYFERPIASVLTSRGCWRDCAFCSINAWYERSGGGRKFRYRSIENISTEVAELYSRYGVRIFNFQDDNFFLPNPTRAAERFESLRDRLREAGVKDIAIAIKARPDSITRESVRVLDQLGLFRVFLGVENAAENGLKHLNRKCQVQQILNALEILNEGDVHIAYNLLMFEPDTVMEDLLINLRFMERHLENPFNFCRAEAYAGTGLETWLRAEGRLLGDNFGFDYRLKDPRCEAFHQIANHAFWERNFSDFGLHYFNMQVDFYFQLLRLFHPALLTQALRAAVRNFIKKTNLDTYECLAEIYDFVASVDPREQVAIKSFARQMRQYVDGRSARLHGEGQRILDVLTETYEKRDQRQSAAPVRRCELPLLASPIRPYTGLAGLEQALTFGEQGGPAPLRSPFGPLVAAVPYSLFKEQAGATTRKEVGAT